MPSKKLFTYCICVSGSTLLIKPLVNIKAVSIDFEDSIAIAICEMVEID